MLSWILKKNDFVTFPQKVNNFWIFKQWVDLLGKVNWKGFKEGILNFTLTKKFVCLGERNMLVLKLKIWKICFNLFSLKPRSQEKTGFMFYEPLYSTDISLRGPVQKRCTPSLCRIVHNSMCEMLNVSYTRWFPLRHTAPSFLWSFFSAYNHNHLRNTEKIYVVVEKDVAHLPHGTPVRQVCCQPRVSSDLVN